MTKRLEWIGVLSLVCAVVSAGPAIEAQNRSNRGAGLNARVAQPQPMGHRPAPGAAAPKGEANNRGQHSDASAPASPAGLAASPAGAAQSQPSGVVPTQTPGIPPTPPPQSNQLKTRTPIASTPPASATTPPASPRCSALPLPFVTQTSPRPSPFSS